MRLLFIIMFLVGNIAFGNIRETIRNGEILLENKGISFTVKKNYKKKTFYETYNDLVKQYGKKKLTINPKANYIRLEDSAIFIDFYIEKEFVMILWVDIEDVTEENYENMQKYFSKNSIRLGKQIGVNLKKYSKIRTETN